MIEFQHSLAHSHITQADTKLTNNTDLNCTMFQKRILDFFQSPIPKHLRCRGISSTESKSSISDQGTIASTIQLQQDSLASVITSASQHDRAVAVDTRASPSSLGVATVGTVTAAEGTSPLPFTFTFSFLFCMLR